MSRKSKRNNSEIEIDINIDELFEDIYKEYGQNEENYGKWFSFDDYIIKKYPNNTKKGISNLLYDKLKSKYGRDYKNITLNQCDNKISIHVTKFTFFFKDLESLYTLIKMKSVLTIFGILAVVFLFLYCSVLMKFEIFYTFLTCFFVINVLLFYIYGFEIILIVSGAYFLIKNIILILSSVFIIYLPYIKYFDINIYNYSLVLICLIISVPIIIKIIFTFISALYFISTIIEKRNVENYNNSLINVSKIYEKSELYITIYKNMITRITTIRGFSFDFFKIHKYKKFMYFYICVSLFFLGLLKFDFNSYYYTENNGYCSNIGNDVKINRLDNNENIVHVLSSNEYNSSHSIYTFNDMYRDKKYVYETNCERGILKYNQERFYSINDVLNGLAPVNNKIIVYGVFGNNNLLLNDEDNNQKINVKFENDFALVLMEIIGDLKNKEFIAYEAFVIDDNEKSITEAKRKLNKIMDK